MNQQSEAQITALRQVFQQMCSDETRCPGDGNTFATMIHFFTSLAGLHMKAGYFTPVAEKLRFLKDRIPL
jgi:hypothetical protein